MGIFAWALLALAVFLALLSALSLWLVHFSLLRAAPNSSTTKLFNKKVPHEAVQVIVSNEKKQKPALDAWLACAQRSTLRRTAQNGDTLVCEQIITHPESRRWAILVHGYRGCHTEMYGYGLHFAQKGYNLLLPDLRGHGESSGRMVGFGTWDHRDVLDWAALLCTEHPEAEIVLHGHSMGGATVAMAAGANPPPQVFAVVSDCPYTSAWELFHSLMGQWFHLPAFPLLSLANLFFKLEGGYDLHSAAPLEAVKKSETPLLFIHGTHDLFIPCEMSRQLYGAAHGPKQLLLVEGATHACSQYADPALYYKTVFDFLEKYQPATV